MDYSNVAKRILEEIGGEGNITSVMYCYTRLRITLKDDTIVDDERVKKIKGVMGIMRKGSGSYQVIIGNDVANCYKEFMKLGDFLEEGGDNKNVQPRKGGNAFARFFELVSGCMVPILSGIIAGGMMKVLQVLISMSGFVPEESTTFTLVKIIGDAPFYFIPVLLAFSCAKKFKVTPYLAVAVVAILVHPDFVQLMGEGGRITFFGIPVTVSSYSYSVIPVILIVWAMGYIEHFVDKITPIVTKNFLKPLLILLISAPVAFCVLGPIGAIGSQF